MTEPALPNARPSRARRILRRVVLTTAMLALLGLSGAFWATGHLGHPLVKGRIQGIARDMVGADLDYDSGEVGLSGLRLRGVRIRNQAPDDALVGDLLRMASVEVRWDAQRLASGDRHLDTIEVEDVALGVVVGGEGGWSGARALTLPAASTPTEPLRPSQLWASLAPLQGIDVTRYTIGPTTLTTAALQSTGSRMAVTLPALDGHVDITGPQLRALVRADGVATIALAPGEAAMAALAPIRDQIQAQLPGWVLPPPPWSGETQVTMRLEPVSKGPDAGPGTVPTVRLAATMAPNKPGASRGRWLDMELELAPTPDKATTDVTLRRLRLGDGVISAEGGLAVTDANSVDALPTVTTRALELRLDSGDRARDVTIANVALHFGAAARASARLEPMVLQPPWQADASAKVELPEVTATALAVTGATAAAAPAATVSIATAQGELHLVWARDELQIELTTEAERLDARAAAGSVALQGPSAQVRGSLPKTLLLGGEGDPMLGPAALLECRARKAEVATVAEVAGLAAAATLVDAAATLSIRGDLGGGEIRGTVREFEGKGPNGAWLQALGVAMSLDVGGVKAWTAPAPGVIVADVAARAACGTLRGGAGLTAGLRDAAFALSMEGLHLDLGNDASLACDGIRLDADARELRAEGRERVATLHAESTIADLQVPFVTPLATTLRATSKLRAPGLDAALTLDKGDDLRWDANLGAPALRKLVQGLGMAWPKSLRLDGLAGRSKGSVLRIAATLAALAKATGPAGLAASLPALQIEHTGALTLDGAGWSQPGFAVASRRVTMRTDGGGKGMDQLHHVEARIEGGRFGDAALPPLAATGEARTSADPHQPGRLLGGSLDGRGAVDGQERATARLSVQRGAVWRVEAAATMRKLGRLASELMKDLPCPDPSRLSAEGQVALSLHAPGHGELAPLLAWLTRPEQWHIDGKGEATIHGIACHLVGDRGAGDRGAGDTGRAEATADGATGRARPAPAAADADKGGIAFDAAMPEVKGEASFTLRNGKAEMQLRAAMQRLRGAFGAHPFDVRRATAEAKLRAPVSANLRGSSLEATFAVGELRQDLLPTWRVADTKGELRVAIDNRGRIELERLRVDNTAGGSSARIDGIIDRIGDTSVLGVGDASGVPGSRGVALQGELTQDLGALGEMFGLRMGGKVALPFELESGDLTVFGLRTRARLDAVDLRHEVLRVAASEISGEVPFAIELVVDRQGVRPLGGGRRSAWSRWRFADHHPFMSGDHFVSVGKLRWRDESFGPLAGNARFDHDVFRLDQLELRVLGGQVTGSCVVELDGASTKVLLRGNATDIRLPGNPGRLDANAALEIEPWKFAIAGRAQLLRITTAHLRAMLDAFDPYREDVQANRARMALHLGRPEQARLRFRHGFVDLWLQLGGLAEAVSIDEIRGVPLGPMMTRWLEPLLGDPPP